MQIRSLLGKYVSVWLDRIDRSVEWVNSPVRIDLLLALHLFIVGTRSGLILASRDGLMLKITPVRDFHLWTW